MVSNDGLRALGEWPTGSELAEALPAILRALADREPDSDKKAALKRGADILQSVAVNMASEVVKQVLRGM
jgi:hypothetical protein